MPDMSEVCKSQKSWATRLLNEEEYLEKVVEKLVFPWLQI